MTTEAVNDTMEPASGRPGPPNGWTSIGAGLVSAVALMAVSLALAVQFIQNRPVDLRAQTRPIASVLEKSLRYQQVPPTLITATAPTLKQNTDASYYHTELTARVPDSVHFDGLVNILETALASNGIFAIPEEPSRNTTRLRFFASEHEVATVTLTRAVPEYEPARPTGNTPGHRNAGRPERNAATAAPAVGSGGLGKLEIPRRWTPPRPVEVEQSRLPDTPTRERPINTTIGAASPRVAIVVDDGGYGGPETDIILGLDPNLTISILPYTPFGAELSERCRERGFEVLLHMPMSNQSATLRHEGQINVGMTAEEIARLTREALQQVPDAVGVNNHTGSAFTANPDAMRPFLEFTQSRGLFFLDSRTTPHSVAYRTAVEMGLEAAERTLFLDHDNAPEAIRSRFRQLIAHARENGSAIGICHFRPNTAIILKEMLPELRANGVGLVPLSELIS